MGVALALGLAAALTFAFTTLSARMIGAARAGDFLSGVFVLSFVVTASAPLGATASRFAARYRALGDDAALRGLSLSLTLIAAVGLAGVGGIALVTRAATTLLNIPSLPSSWWLIVGAAAMALTLVTLLRGLLRGLERFDDFNENVLVESVTRICLGLALAGLYRSAVAALLGYAFGAIACLLVGWRRVRRGVGSGGRTRISLARYLSFLLPMGLMALAHAGYQNLDVLVVRGLFDSAEAGAYGAAAVLAQLATLLLTPFSTTLLPRASVLHARAETTRKEWSQLLLRNAFAYIAVCGPLLVLYALVGEWLVPALYGLEFASGGAWLLPITASVIAGGLGLLVIQCLAAQGAFGFLIPYWLCGVVGAVWIYSSASNPAEVAWILVWTKLAALATLILIFVHRLAPRSHPALAVAKPYAESARDRARSSSAQLRASR